MLNKRLRRTLPILCALLLTSACGAVPISPPNTPSALNPHGPAAAHLASLWWVMFALGAAVWLLVIILMFAALLRRHRATADTPANDADRDAGRNWPLFGIGLTVTILTIVFAYNVYILAKVENPPNLPGIHLQVVGRRWWWEVRYTDSGIETANEIHIPVGVPVSIQLEAYDVIHSFWVPQLHGKMDLIPTRINNITIQADQPGVYRGQCAEFCGLQHGHMGFLVIAQSKADYDKWLHDQEQPAAKPSAPQVAQGQQVFLSQGCAFCHQIRGLDDHALVRTNVRLGPDLTHLQSRMTIAAATLTNNTGNLAGWVSDAQHVKPGSLMPNQSMNSRDLQNLLAYLETLH
jgi:cytochrome c oxidase subunit 2